MSRYLDAQDYIAKIRNPYKRDYARYYLAFREGEIRERELESEGGMISAMARQAVRVRVDRILEAV